MKFIFLLLILLACEAVSGPIYNGETVKFSTSSSWDANGSSLRQASAAPFSKPNHLRATLKVKNWWAAAAYVPKGWQPVALSESLSFRAKSSRSHELMVQLQDANKKVSDLFKINATPAYVKHTIPLSMFTGVDTSKITAIIFAVSLKGTASYTVDVDDIETGSTPGGTPPSTPPSTPGKSQARKLAIDLTGRPYFMTGGTYGSSAGTKSDIHYRYLVGGWRKWNAPDGEYANMVMRDADSMGAVPQFTYYKLAFEFEKKNNFFIMDEASIHEYLQDMRLLFQKMGAFGKPVILHLEPDFFGYLQQYSVSIGKPARAIPARLRFTDIPECMAMPEMVDSLMDCIITMGRTLAPKARIGFHASQWGDWYDMNDPNAPAQQKAYSVADFLKSVNADKTDFIVLETSDRDAGYLEAVRGAKGAYWSDKDRENHLKWVGYIAERLQKPVLWWQMPMGVPSDSPGTKDHYRDNRVKYFYEMVPRLVSIGGVGMLFGAGADEQTTTDTDGGQLKRFNDAYQSSRVELK